MEYLDDIVFSLINVGSFVVCYFAMRWEVSDVKRDYKRLEKKLADLEQQIENYENAYPPHWRKERPALDRIPRDDATVPRRSNDQSDAMRRLFEVIRDMQRRPRS